MGDPATFWPEVLPYAEQAHAGTGVLISVLMAQAAIETGYGGFDWSVAHNPGNVGSFDGNPVNTFPTLEAGTEAWIQTLNLGYYRFVRSAVGYVNQSIALGQSPWASAHYRLPGGSDGSELIYVVQHYDLTQYDGAQPTPPPGPAPSPPYVPTNNPVPSGGVFMIPTGCTDTGAVQAQIREWWDTYRTDAMTVAEANLFQLVFYEPASSNGYAGNPSLLLAGIVDDAQSKGKLRPQFAGAV